jgi:hypothetical protein
MLSLDLRSEVKVIPNIVLLVTDITMYMYNSYDTNFDAPDVHFDKLCLFSDFQAETL